MPGKHNAEADAVSRTPLDQGKDKGELGEGPEMFTARTAVIGIISQPTETAADVALEKVKAAFATDPTMTAFWETISAGFHNEKCNLPLALRPFWDVRHRLEIDDGDGMLVMDACILLPRILEKETLKTLINMHQGASKMRQRARLSLSLRNAVVKKGNMTML